MKKKRNVKGKDKYYHLVLRAQNGEKEALSELYQIFHNDILYFLYSRINSLHDARDITADVFLTFVDRINKFQYKSSVKNYLFGIAKIHLINYLKAKYGSRSYVLESNMAEDEFLNIPGKDFEESRSTNLYRDRLRKLVSKVFERISPRYARVLDLRFNQSVSVKEAAKVMGLTENNLKVLQHRALKAAHDSWEEMQGNYRLNGFGEKDKKGN